MARILIVLLIIALPANALAAMSCCSDIKTASQAERPCHEPQDTQQEMNHDCEDCVFCATVSLFLPHSDSGFVERVVSERPQLIQFFIDSLSFPPFKPPKSV